MTGIELKKLRESLGLNQQEMAELTGITLPMISSMESGRRAITTKSELKIIASTKARKLEINKVRAVQDSHADKVAEMEGLGYGNAMPTSNTDQMMMMIMANNTTSSVTLEFVCEVLSNLTDQKVDAVKVRAKQLMQEKAQKLSAVLDVIF